MYLSAPAALLLTLAATSPLSAQHTDLPWEGATSAAPYRFVLSGALVRPGVHQPTQLSEEYDGTTGARASLGYVVSGGIEVGVAYEGGRFEPRRPGGVSSTVHAVTLMGTVLASHELPVRPFLELGPSLVVFDDETDAVGYGGDSVVVGGATLGAGVRVRVTRRVDARAGATVLVTDGPRNDPTRLFSGLHLGLALGL